MGCSNVIGWQTKLPILHYDEIFVIIGVYKSIPKCHDYWPGKNFTPVCLPIFGQYNDYGSIEFDSADENVKLIERLSGLDIDEFLHVLLANAGRSRWGSFTDEYKSLIEKLEPLLLKDNKYNYTQKFDKEKDLLCFTMDHAFLFNNFKDKVLTTDFDEYCAKTEKVRKIKEKRQERYIRTVEAITDDSARNRLKNEMTEYMDFTPKEDSILLDPNLRSGYFFAESGFDHCPELFMAFYKNESSSLLFNELKDNYREFISFYLSLINHSYILDLHNSASQYVDEDIEDLLPLYKQMVAYIENVIRKSKEDEEE